MMMFFPRLLFSVFTWTTISCTAFIYYNSFSFYLSNRKWSECDFVPFNFCYSLWRDCKHTISPAIRYRSTAMCVHVSTHDSRLWRMLRWTWKIKMNCCCSNCRLYFTMWKVGSTLFSFHANVIHVYAYMFTHYRFQLLTHTHTLARAPVFTVIEFNSFVLTYWMIPFTSL